MKKLAAILNRKFSDRLNPVWVKEMRQMLNGRALLGSAAALIIAGLLFSYLGPAWRGLTTDPVFFLYLFCYWVILLIPVLECVSRWHYERGQDCLTPEYTTGLSAFTILNGKLLAALTSTLILFLIGLPVCFLFHSEWPFIDFFILFLPNYLMTVTLLFLLCLLPQRKKTSPGSLPDLVLIGLLFWIADFVLLAILVAHSLEPEHAPILFHSSLLSLAAAVECYFWCHARLLPARANRMLLPRIAGLVLCLLFIPADGVYSFNTGVLFSVYGVINILAASCERFELTERCRAELPKKIIPRLIVLFFSSGAYSGLIYGMAFLTAGAVWKGMETVTFHSVCFYLLFYALLALVIRRWKPGWTPWALLLVYAFCNFLALFNIVHPDGWFSILTPMNILEGNARLIVPLALSGAVLLIVLIQAILPSASRREILPK
ncbi:MAG: hypothetical protein E7055_13350 [Lentisphaerae bacterium]|nr:hypothetical protein [Lentisphaerota bacterium]